MRIAPAPERLIARLKLERNGVPIYVQIRDQILQAVRAGLIGSGERLPTMRQVAVALRVDLNTVRHAYDELERLGALTLERGRGSFVSDTQAPAGGDPDRALALAAEVLAQARAAGVDPGRLARALASLIEEEEPQ
jgi:GntR family transcriptional regulator